MPSFDHSNIFPLVSLLLGIPLGGWLSWYVFVRRPLGTSETMAMTKDAHSSAELRSRLAQTQLAYRMVVEMSQFRSGYLARSAHELRSPLNSIIGIHQMILADLCDDPAEEREFLAQANDAALKLVQLMDRVIHVAKVEHGNEPLQLRPLQLSLVLAEVEELSRLQAQNRNLTLQIDLPAPDVYVLADLPCFRQVLLNLVDTPLRLMQDGTVSLTSYLEGNYVFVEITDDRPFSVWQEPIEWLRQPIDQVNLATPELSPGLTLIMDQTLLEAMGGRLELLAVPGYTTYDPSKDTDSFDPSTKTRIRCLIPRVGSC